MKLKKKGTFTREEMAQYLTKLSGMIADGVVDFEAGQEVIGDRVNFVLEVKRKKASLELELSMKLSTANQGAQKGLSDRIHYPTKKTGKRERPYRAKQLKKTLGAVWKDFKRTANEIGMVDDETIERLKALMNEYDAFVESAWSREWKECASLVEQAIDTYKRGELDQFNRLAQEIDAVTKRCHKVYK